MDRARAALAHLIRVRTISAGGDAVTSFDGHPDDAPKGARPWFQVEPRAWSDHTAVFGHWSALGLRLGPQYVALDSGCVWGGPLTAVRLEDRAVFQVAAKETAPLQPNAE
jgi:bis(5'-nucleosyl)-tetraphosphatase (symmetrical)